MDLILAASDMQMPQGVHEKSEYQKWFINVEN